MDSSLVSILHFMQTAALRMSVGRKYFSYNHIRIVCSIDSWYRAYWNMSLGNPDYDQVPMAFLSSGLELLEAYYNVDPAIRLRNNKNWGWNDNCEWQRCIDTLTQKIMSESDRNKSLHAQHLLLKFVNKFNDLVVDPKFYSKQIEELLSIVGVRTFDSTKLKEYYEGVEGWATVFEEFKDLMFQNKRPLIVEGILVDLATLNAMQVLKKKIELPQNFEESFHQAYTYRCVVDLNVQIDSMLDQKFLGDTYDPTIASINTCCNMLMELNNRGLANWPEHRYCQTLTRHLHTMLYEAVHSHFPTFNFGGQSDIQFYQFPWYHKDRHLITNFKAFPY